MYVLGGRYRGRRLCVPQSSKVRPTASRVRAALFNILDLAAESTVLDLFAGSGAIGIEALSRGAIEATFVEQDRQAAKLIRKNLQSLDRSDRVVQGDAFQWVKKQHRAQFDLIYIDPPYALALDNLLMLSRPLLRPGGRLVLEQGKHDASAVDGVLLQRIYGDTILYFFASSHGLESKEP